MVRYEESMGFSIGCRAEAKASGEEAVYDMRYV